MVEVEVHFSWNRGSILKGICIHFRITHRPFIWAVTLSRPGDPGTQHSHTYSTFAQVFCIYAINNLTPLANEPVALWPAWPFLTIIYYNMMCIYMCVCVLFTSMFIWILTCANHTYIYIYPCVWAMTLSNSICQVRVINAVPVSDSWLFHGSFFACFSLADAGIVFKIIPFFSYSACACVQKMENAC